MHDVTLQMHGLSGAEGSDPSTARLVHQLGVDTYMPAIDEVALGCGTRANDTHPCLDTEVAEFILFDTILSMVDLDRVSGYLSPSMTLAGHSQLAPGSLPFPPAMVQLQGEH